MKYLSVVKRRTDQNFAVEFVQVLREEKSMLIDWPRLHLLNTWLLVVTKELEIPVILAGIGCTIPITFYLKNGTLPEDYNASRRLKVRASCIPRAMY